MNKKKYLLLFLILLLLSAGLGAAVYLAQQQQIIPKRAAVPAEEGGIAEISLDPAVSTVSVGQTIPVNITIDTKGRSIAGVSVHLDLSPAGTFAITRSQPNSAINLTFNVNNYTDDYVELLATTTASGGIVPPAGSLLATITLTAQSAGSASLAFNSSLTMITDAASAKDILLCQTQVSGCVIASAGAYTVSGGGATATPPPELTSTPTPEPTSAGGDEEPAATSTPRPTSGGGGATPTPVATLPSAGVELPTIGLLSIGILLLFAGGWQLLIAN